MDCIVSKETSESLQIPLLFSLPTNKIYEAFSMCQLALNTLQDHDVINNAMRYYCDPCLTNK